MPFTKPIELSRYSLTNETVTHSIIVTILRYASSQQAKKAFEMSWGARPAAPKKMKADRWDAAHRWPTDLCLLKSNYVVGLYDVPSDFSTDKTDRLLGALADNIAKAEPGVAGGP